MAKYLDIANFSEDDRINMIGKAALQMPNEIAFLVDDVPGKPERYIQKLLNKFPQLEVFYKEKGPLPNVVTIKVKRNVKTS